jgi:hypothetical protein
MDAMDWFNQFQQLAEYEGAESSLNSFSLHCISPKLFMSERQRTIQLGLL